MAKHGTGHARYLIVQPSGAHTETEINGRDRWALECLMRAGLDGGAPLRDTGPSWSAYVLSLRGMGVQIETIHDRHGGDYPGHHGRYVLRSAVSRIGEGGAA